MVKKFHLSLVFLLIALCSSAFAEVGLYSVHETLVDVSYKYRDNPPNQNLDTFDFDSWISYDQTARFFCLTLEVTDPERDFDQYDFPYGNPPTFKINSSNYSYFDSYKLVRASGNEEFKLAPANNEKLIVGNDLNRYQKFGTSKSGYVPVNDMGEQIHCLVEADGGLNGVNVTWNMPYEEEKKNGTVPNFKTTAQQLADIVPYIEYTREADSEFINNVRAAADALMINPEDKTSENYLQDNKSKLSTISSITGFKWRFVKTSDLATPVSLDKDIHVQIIGVNEPFWGRMIYSGDVKTVAKGSNVEGEETFNEATGLPSYSNIKSKRAIIFSCRTQILPDLASTTAGLSSLTT